MDNNRISPLNNYRVPEWVKESIFYHIFPDRFAQSTSDKVLPNIGRWDLPPKAQEYKGGDLLGINNRLDYLEQIGINAVLLNPIFQASSNHRYNTHDYYQIDPMLGGDSAFQTLIQSLNMRKIPLILDGVFSHTGRGFFQFIDILDNGSGSPYFDWYTIKGWPLSPYDGNNPANYDCWHNLRELPSLNIDNPTVRNYLYEVGEYWLNQGISGWRIDSPESVKTFHFWEEFYQRMKTQKPDSYIIGEIWQQVSPWMDGKHFDGLTNYLFTEIVLAYVAGSRVKNELLQKPYPKRDLYPFPPLDAEQFGEKLNSHIEKFPGDLLFGQLNLLGSHDIPRIMTLVGNDEASVRLAALLQMTFVGTPCIYYGDEIGMVGGPDPDCRRTFPWDNTSSWNLGLLSFYKKMISIRKKYRALRHGQFQALLAVGQTFSFARFFEDQCVIVIINAGDETQSASIPTGDFFENNKILYSPITGKQFIVKDNSIAINIAARQAEVIGEAG